MITHQQRCFGLARLGVSLITLLFLGQAYGLGLGKLKVLSALDEPLVAEIQLNAVTDEALDSLEISLGSAEDFERAEIDLLTFLKQLEFRVRKVGNPAIRINTTQPAKEPFLHFLIRAEWSDGKLVREYTALLDPPLYATQQPTVVSTPAVIEEAEQPSTETSMEQPVTESVPAFPLQQSTTTGSESASASTPQQTTSTVSEFSGAEYGLTERGDTLWDIASQLDTRGYDANIFQIMIAMQKENPNAFEAGNINRLKVGQILRLADIDAVASISAEEASRIYTAQLEEWESYKLVLAETSDVLKVPAQDSTAGTVSSIESSTEAAPSASTESPAATTSAAEPVAEAEASDAVADTPEPAEAEMAETVPATPTAAPDTAETDTSSTEAATTEQDLLKIVRATLEQEEGEAAGTSDSQAELDAVKAAADKEVSALRDQIATIEEALVSGELQNKQLQERITLLEGQVENAQRLVDLENEELALAQKQATEAQQLALETKQQAEQQMVEAQKLVAQAEVQTAETEQRTVQQIQQAEQQAAQQVAQAEQQAAQQVAQAEQQAAQQVNQAGQQAEQQIAEAEQQAAQQIQQAEQQALQAQQQAEQQSGQVAAVEPEAKQNVVEPIATEPKQAVQPVAQKPTKAWWENLLDTLTGSSITVIAAVVGILVLLVSLLLIIRRRRSIAEFEESILTGSALDGQTETTETEATGTGTDTSFLSDFGMAGMGTMQADEVDPLAEAEVYLAYGRDEQAEEVLKEAAARDASRHELKLKLLEIYQQRKDLNSFETLAEELYPAGDQGDAATWAKVVEMGLKMNPDNPLFSKEAPTAITESLTEALPATVREALSEPADEIEDLDGLEKTLVDKPLQQVAVESGDDDLIEMSQNDDTADSFVARASPEANDEDALSLSDDSSDALPLVDDSDTLPGEAVASSVDSSDPALNPFPTPDQNAGLNEELDRLSQQIEETSVSMSAEETAAQKSSGDADMLNFATTDPSELEFDIDLDDAPAAPGGDRGAELEAVQEESSPLKKTADASSDDEFVNLDLELAEETEIESPQGQQQADDKETSDEEFLNLDFGEVEETQSEKTGAEASFELEPAYGEELPAVDDDNPEKWDEAATKLDLAQAYLNMGDKAGARSIIDEVMKEGSPAQKNQAAELAAQIS